MHASLLTPLPALASLLPPCAATTCCLRRASCSSVAAARADPFVDVGLSEKGEHVLGAAGEVHLETVVKDLRERFARVDFQVRHAQHRALAARGVQGGGCQGRAMSARPLP